MSLCLENKKMVMTPYAIISICTTGIATLVAGLAWRRRNTPGGTSLAWLMLAVAWWSATLAVEYTTIGIPGKVFWAKLEYIGTLSCPVFFLLLALEYNQLQAWLTRRNIALLFVIPCVTLGLAATNEWHGLVWTSFTPSPVGQNLLVYGRGAAYWIGVVGYSYLTLFAGALLIAWAVFRFPAVYRPQALTLLLAALVPWAGDLFEEARLAPGVELTPLVLVFAGVAMAWSIFRLGLLDLVPVARETLVETMTDGLLVLDEQNRVVDLNPAARALLPVPLTQVLGRPATEALAAWPALAQACASPIKQVELRLEGAGGACIFDLRCTPLRNRSGALTGQLLTLHDITQRKQAEAALRASQRKYQQLVETMQEGLCIANVDGRILFVNPRMSEMLGCAPTDLLAQNLFGFLDRGWEDEIDVKFHRKDGGAFYATLTTSPILDDDGYSQGTLFGVIDITERRQMEDRLADLSLVDELTGLHNRRGFQFLARQELKVADRLKQRLALLYVDLDGMKRINDTWGHQTGDEAMRDTAQLLKSTLRASDVIARYGGDEFVGLVLETKENSDEDLLHRLTDNLKAYNLQTTRSYPLSLSFGITRYDPAQPCSLEALLEEGDRLMYAQKQQKAARRT
jgi:diguanylate cyclase (GGDEF)-like protein/PAS domain S-box-containing protein